MIGYKLGDHFPRIFSASKTRCSRPPLLPHTRGLLFCHHQRPTRAMDPSPTCFVRRAPSCVPTPVTAIGRHRFLNALARSSAVSLVTPSLAILACDRIVQLPLMRELIKRS